MAGLYFQVHEGNGPYLLLVHGMLSSASQWLPNIEHLSETCQPVTVELYGHHRSPSPAQLELYDPLNYVKQFEKIRETLNAKRWLVCGYSLGAALTIRYALTYPERLYGHIFTNSMSAFAESELQNQWAANATQTRSNLIAGGLAAIDRIPVHPKHAKRLPADLKDRLVADSKKHSPLGIANTLSYTVPRSSVRHIIHNNSAVALLIAGQYEKRFRPYSEFAIKSMPNLSLDTVAASHAVSMEAAAEFNFHINQFIRQDRGIEH